MEGVIFDGNFMLNITQTRENNENFIMYDSCIKGHFEKIFLIKLDVIADLCDTAIDLKYQIRLCHTFWFQKKTQNVLN